MSRSFSTIPAPAHFGFRGNFLTSAHQLEAYSGASGILAATPRAAALPDDAADVAALARWAAATRTPLVPRGAGTGMPGGNVGPGVVVDLQTNFRGAPQLEPAARRVRAQPGLTRIALNRAIEESGLFFPVDPSSGDRCTLGGMVANNSSGAHTVRYGATRRWVRSLDIVLADGSPATLTRGARAAWPLLPIETRVRTLLEPMRSTIEHRWPRVRKNSSGYALREYLESGDLIDLIIGSEGTLALITGMELDLAPIPPASGLLLFEFDSLERALEGVLRLLPLHPDTCEILDRTFLDLVRQGAGDAFGLRPGLEAILLVEATADSQAGTAARLGEMEAALGPLPVRVRSATDPAAVEELWSIRHAASPIIAREAGNRVSMQFIEDSVVPVENLSAYIRALRAILAKHQLPAVIFGHAGDGNLHVNPLVDITVPAWRTTLERVLDEVTTTVVELGGTLSGEHGDGRLRAPLLHRVWGEEIVAAFEQVKLAFDPEGLLNPGVILPSPGQRPFDHLRAFG